MFGKVVSDRPFNLEISMMGLGLLIWLYAYALRLMNIAQRLKKKKY